MTECVYCAIRLRSLNKIQYNLSFFKGRAMALAVSRQPLSVEAGFRSQAGRCEICGAQSGTGTGFLPSTYFLLC